MVLSVRWRSCWRAIELTWIASNDMLSHFGDDSLNSFKWLLTLLRRC
jgi:hypothetical protein